MLGTVIKKHREDAGWTQEQLAKSADIARTHLISIEQGASISLSTLRKVAEALGVTAWQLLQEADDA